MVLLEPMVLRKPLVHCEQLVLREPHGACRGPTQWSVNYTVLYILENTVRQEQYYASKPSGSTVHTEDKGFFWSLSLIVVVHNEVDGDT